MSSQALLDQQKKYPNCEFLPKLIEKFHIFWEIYEACGKKWVPNCGSYLFDGTTYDYCPLMYEKQKLLYDKAKNSTRALEIGVYHGHSLFIMLLAKPDLTVHLIDIDDTFALPAAQILANYFPQAKLTFMKSDSQVALPQVNMTFDLFHIDGLHDENYITKDPRSDQKTINEIYSSLLDKNRAVLLHTVTKRRKNHNILMDYISSMYPEFTYIIYNGDGIRVLCKNRPVIHFTNHNIT